MRAEIAWLVLIGTIATYEVLAHPEQLLTHGADRIRARHPLTAAAVYLSIVATGVHLGGYRGRWDVYRALSPVRAHIRKEHPARDPLPADRTGHPVPRRLSRRPAVAA